jgi:hypothetical protein
MGSVQLTKMPKIKKGNPTVKRAVLASSVLLLISLIAAGVFYFDAVAGHPYVAVQMTNGDMYFGRLYRFPKLQLGNVYVIQPMADQSDTTKTILQVVPLDSITFWGPDKLELNDEQIVFIAKVGENSQVMNAIQGIRSAAQPTQL